MTGPRQRDRHDGSSAFVNIPVPISVVTDALNPRPRTEGQESEAVRIAVARAIAVSRQRRGGIIDMALLGEPGWDVLLDVYVAEKLDKPVSVSSACFASGAPATTSLRRIKALVDREALTREADPGDGRRVLLHLSATTRAAIDRWLDQHIASLRTVLCR